jgi:uncharacterized protein YeaO (DUF488 family)
VVIDLTPDVQIKRAYDPAEPGDGFRVLVDRLWPRGVSRVRAHLDEWGRELAPSDELRKWFNHNPERFQEFRTRYRRELRAHADRIDKLRASARQGRVTLVYGARDETHNNAVVLAELLREG